LQRGHTIALPAPASITLSFLPHSGQLKQITTDLHLNPRESPGRKGRGRANRLPDQPPVVAFELARHDGQRWARNQRLTSSAVVPSEVSGLLFASTPTMCERKQNDEGDAG
jgi:hypothetical protein